MKILATARPEAAANAPAGTIPVLLYARRGSMDGAGTIGHQVEDAVWGLPARPSQAAYDFLTLALAVIASETFVRRDEAPDGWARSIDLHVELGAPKPWQALATRLGKALGFLTGDQWHLTFSGKGRICPDVEAKLCAEDSASLFSGGLDSMIGAIHLKAEKRHPLLVSQAYPREGTIQGKLASVLGMTANHFAANADPRFDGMNDTSMRARSLLFIAYGVAAASALAARGVATPVELYIPENGFIALNAPLTLRRIGSHSTRTTHPYFLDQMRGILWDADLPTHLINPFELMTKGEMMRAYGNDQSLVGHASGTVSCGKWKRKGMQCGRCFPCLIRRAAFHASSITDATRYRFPNIAKVAQNIDEHDDLIAVRLAIRKARSARLDTWVSLGGPLPLDPSQRRGYVDVFRRGLAEVETYLKAVGCPA